MIDSVIGKIQERSPIKIHLLLLIISILIQASGAVCTKYAAGLAPSSTFFGINTTLIIYCIILGGMGLQVFFWQAALSYYSLSFAYPFRSLVSFIVLLAAFFLFQESVTLFNVVGLIIISVGIFYLVRDEEALN
jgi:multidrug transporter EmrE-like cation transporter